MSGERGAGEFALIRRIRSMLSGSAADLAIGPGDDCAAVRVDPDRLILLTCDVLVEGRHFVRGHVRPRDIGRKLAAVNLSDVAAMGGSPKYGILSLVVPGADSGTWTEEIAAGVAEELSKHEAVLAGGNLSGAVAGIVADLTLVGEVGESRVLKRSGARTGDAILVTGHLGASAAGLRVLVSETEDRALWDDLVTAHQLPSPRVREGRIIAEWGRATSMIDVSDGIASDLGHLCEESGVGAEIRIEDLPVLDRTREAANTLGVPVEALVLAGGEDYELLLTVPEDGVEEVVSRVRTETGTDLTRIGTITRPGEGIRWLDTSGNEVPLDTSGWDHFA